jgi:hypothetical protein
MTTHASLRPLSHPQAAAGVLDQNPPHGLSRGAKEMRAVLPLRLCVGAEPQPGFMDERSGLQGVAR